MSQPVCEYSLGIDVYRGGAQAEPIGRVPVDVDLVPISEWAWLADFRHRGLLAPPPGANPTQIEPLWHATLGAPYLAGLSARAAAGAVSCTIPTAYFQAVARRVVAALIQQQYLNKGDVVRYLVSAVPAPAAAEPAPALRFAVESASTAPPLHAADMAELLAAAQPSGPSDERDLPVTIPQHVLDEAAANSRAAGAAETGGILLGHLCRDRQSGALFIQVTAQVPARLAKQELTQLTFDHQAWADMAAAVALRQQDEILLGFWHSHPAKCWQQCQDCPEEKRAACNLSGEFFSAQDAGVFRTVFPRAYSLALVVSESHATGLTFPLYGWREGMIKVRGFYVQGATSPGQAPAGRSPGWEEQEHVENC